MTWWQILLVFVGIPAAVFVVITAVVFRFATARVPDGLARAAEQDNAEEPEPAGEENPAADDPHED